ncbi:MAG: transposase [Planctomycetes bacterium]|nr:transposase [Planctomycetota bacterium]
MFTPKHSSWLNQIEIIFGVISRRMLRGGSFSSKADLQDKLERFIDYFNTRLRQADEPDLHGPSDAQRPAAPPSNLV